MSEVWSYFDLDPDSSTKAICVFCRCKIPRGGKSSTTSALHKHLKLHAAEIAVAKKRKSEKQTLSDIDDVDLTQPGTSTTQIVPSSRQQTLKEMMNKKAKFPPGDQRSKIITRLIAGMICVDNQLISIVEDRGFRKLVRHLEPRYTIPGRKHLANNVIPEMYNETVEKVRNLLHRAEYISLTMDMWTSTANDDFLGITAHFIDDDYVLLHICLEVKPFLEISHTAHNIIKFITDTLEWWKISENIFCVVRDNARNITAALNESSFQHIPCLAHTFQLVIKDAIFDSKILSGLFSTCRPLVGHFKHSASACKVLKEAQITVGSSLHRLIQDEPTRWNSALHMAKRLLEQKQAIALAVMNLTVPETLTSSQWDLLKNVVHILEMFNQATLVVSTETVTISEIIPIVNSILKQLENLKLPALGGVRNDLIASLKKRYHSLETCELYATAVILDPRIKGKALFTDVQNFEEAKRALINTMQQLGVRAPAHEVQEDPEEPEIIPPLHGMWTYYSQLIDSGKTKNTTTETVTAEDELKMYLQEGPIKPDEDILKYWKSRKTLFSRLAKVSKKYHCCPPASVFSERLFSSAGIIVDQKRSSLDPERLKMLVFLNKNFDI